MSDEPTQPLCSETRSALQGGDRVLSHLAAAIPAATIIDGINKLLEATFVTKSGKKHPDFRAREAGLKLWLNYLVGLPIQRQIIATAASPESRTAAWDRLLQSPAARAEIRRMLDDADNKNQSPIQN